MNIKRMQKSLVNLGKNIFFTEVYFDKNGHTIPNLKIISLNDNMCQSNLLIWSYKQYEYQYFQEDFHMNQKIIKNGTNVVVVTKYKDITPELMLMVLK